MSMLERRIQVRRQLRRAGELDGLTPEAADWYVERTAQAQARGPVRKVVHAGIEWIRTRR